MSDVTHRKRGLRFEKSQLVEFLGPNERVEFLVRKKKKVDFRLLAEALRQVSHVVWGRWKSQHRKIVCLSPYVEKPFNSKVIKSFVPELRSRKCFCFCVCVCVSGFLCYPYMSYEHSMYISHIHVWLCYTYVCIVNAGSKLK